MKNHCNYIEGGVMVIFAKITTFVNKNAEFTQMRNLLK